MCCKIQDSQHPLTSSLTKQKNLLSTLSYLKTNTSWEKGFSWYHWHLIPLWLGYGPTAQQCALYLGNKGPIRGGWEVWVRYDHNWVCWLAGWQELHFLFQWLFFFFLEVEFENPMVFESLLNCSGIGECSGSNGSIAKTPCVLTGCGDSILITNQRESHAVWQAKLLVAICHSILASA